VQSSDGFEDWQARMEKLGRGMEGLFGSGDGTRPDGEPGFETLFAPVDPYNRWPLFAPVVSVLGAAAVFALTGVAVAAMVVLAAALLAVWFLLSEVFGYEVLVPGPLR